MTPYSVLRVMACAAALLLAGSLAAQTLKAEEVAQLKFRHIGPVGNRVTCVAGVPGNDLLYIVGAATGGVWKTSDGGLTWKPVFDKEKAHAIGAVAISMSDPRVVYVGTGESSIRSNVSIGNGVYKSTDGGETWTLIGLENAGRVSRIIIHPTNPDIAWVGALGHAYSPQKERGLHKTTDGGKTWKQVLFVDENTGVSDIAIDPTNPRILFAGMWQLSLKTWNRTSGGVGGGLYSSKDGGDTWTRLKGAGLPEAPVGKIALSMTPAAPDRVYALIETGDGVEKIGDKGESGELWRSDDKGTSWRMINANRNLTGRQAYYTRVSASPDQINDVYFISSTFFTSIDGGRSIEPVMDFFGQPNWDHHEMWIDPTNGNRMAVAGDGGISISKNRAKTWQRTTLPIAQLYHITVDNAIPYNVLTNRQDGPAMRGPSRSGIGGFFSFGIATGLWHDVGGGESGFATPDPKDPNIVWSSASGTGAVGGVVTRYNEKTRHFRQVEIWPEYTAGHTASEVKYRFQWTFPLLISPHDNNTVYATSQVVHRTRNGGQTWEAISPDLTLNDKSKQGSSGGLTPDNIGVEYANVIYAFEESPVRQGVFWAGTNDGLVQLSQDGGKTWTNVTKNLLELPPLGTVRNIEASKWSEGKAFVTVDFHEVGNFQPYVYRTTDFGKTWKKIVKGVEAGNLNYCRSIKEDPIRKGLLYLGTESTLYVSFDDGENWQVFMSNLPHTPMYWLEVQEHFNDLVVGTYGRGAWILDDLTPLQQLPANNGTVKAALFNPKDAYRFQSKTSTMQFFPEPSTGEDPPYGASLNFWSNNDKDSVKLFITGTSGDTVKTFKLKSKPGINRVWWDLRGKETRNVVMRTQPAAADWVSLDKNRTRTGYISNPFRSYLVLPGKYTVSMVAGDQKFTSSINIIKDPNSEGTPADIQAQAELLTKMHADYNTAVDMVNQIEWTRRQISDLRDVLGAKSKYKGLAKSAAKLDSALTVVEGKLVQLKYTGTGQDDVRYPEMLAGKIGYLAGAVGTGDFAPTDSHKEVYSMLKGRLTETQAEYDKLMTTAFLEFIKQLLDNNIGPIVTDWRKK
jgi:photosystem II stability/assembly factor-like uncharacterized protein